MPELQYHPHSPSRVARVVTADVARTPDGKLSLHYALQGDVRHMNVPPPAPPRIGWNHELNFSPSGEWAAYAFSGYHEGTALVDEALNPQIAVESRDGRLDLYALVDLPRLAPAYARGRLRLGLAVIIAEETGGMSYWALKHAPGKPDFHHRDAFALGLDEVRH